MYKILISLISMLSLPSLSFAKPQVLNFSLPTTDLQSSLSGTLSYPSNSNNHFPLVVMVPGTGLFDKDVHFGNSGTEKDLLFVEIEKELIKQGFAIARFSYRGVKCNIHNYTGVNSDANPSEKIKQYLKDCIDFTTRSKVTPENIREDIEQVYSWASNQDLIDSDNIVMFGHSEGTIHISRLVEQKRINPRSLVFMGGVTESPASLIKWQIIDRIIDGLKSMDVNNNDIITNDEIKQMHPNSSLNFYPITALLSSTGSWTKNSLRGELEKLYQTTKLDALAKDDTLPYPAVSNAQASYKWWKMFFTDEKSVLNSIQDFSGNIYYHNGTRDSQTQAMRELNYLAESEYNKLNINFIVHENKGHSLGNNPLFGPISDDSMEILLESFKEVFGE